MTLYTTLNHLSAAALFLVLCFAGICAQDHRSSREAQIEELSHTLDSLRQVIESLRLQDPVSGDTLYALVVPGPTPVEDEEEIGDQRSRRRRLDALLEEYMQRPGVVHFNGDATAILQTTVGEPGEMTTATGSFDLFVATRLGQQTLVFFDLEAIGGDGPGERYETFSSLNDDAGSTRSEDGFDQLRVLEAWVEFAAVGDAATFTAGKIDLTNYFDNNAAANDETAQFYSGAFVNSAALAVPGNGPGVRLRAEIYGSVFFQAGVIDVDQGDDQLFSRLFKIGATGFKIRLSEELMGTYRLYGYSDGGVEDGFGYGISTDQPLGSMLTLFGRWNRNSTELASVTGIRQAWSAGAQFAKRVRGRQLVIAAGWAVTDPAAPHLRMERTFEAYVRRQLNRWSYISPHVQFIRRIAGGPGDVLLFGFRTQFDF